MTMQPKTELVWGLLGHPIEWSDEYWPITISNLAGTKIRYQHMPKDALADLRLQGGMAKFRAYWIPDPIDETKGEWRLLDMVPDTETEAA